MGAGRLVRHIRVPARTANNRSNQSPSTRQKAFDSMRFDPEAGEWILDYDFSK
jgi:hypothetical protein